MNPQVELFTWAAHQPVLSGAVLLGTGLVYGFFGFRLFRFLLAVSCAGLGWLVGYIVADLGGLSPLILGSICAVVLGALSLKFEKPAVIVVSAASWGLLCYYLGNQLGVPRSMLWGVSGVAGGLGVFFAIISYRSMSVVLTTLQGVALMVVGWVALMSRLMPSVGATFRDWANSQALLVPVFLVMLFVAAFSYQAMHQQGDIKTGR